MKVMAAFLTVGTRIYSSPSLVFTALSEECSLEKGCSKAGLHSQCGLIVPLFGVTTSPFIGYMTGGSFSLCIIDRLTLVKTK